MKRNKRVILPEIADDNTEDDIKRIKRIVDEEVRQYIDKKDTKADNITKKRKKRHERS